MSQDLRCRVCHEQASVTATVTSRFSGRDFELAHCPSCRYSFIVNARTDFDVLYGEAYYRSAGADPLVQYEREVADPRTVRLYEWRAIVAIVEHLRSGLGSAHWLDFGCGLGGLVRYTRDRGIDSVGFDDGYAAERIRQDGVPHLSPAELDAADGSFDVVTAIEVLEHLIDPVEALRRIATLLRPGGLLFLTTGNAEPFRNRVETWSYMQPDVHVGFFEPGTLAAVLRRVGLEPAFPGYVPGFTDLYRYKILKNLRQKRRNAIERFVPWPLIARTADRRYRLSAHPIAWKR
jgi:SAM-dependent methyltransferase